MIPVGGFAPKNLTIVAMNFEELIGLSQSCGEFGHLQLLRIIFYL